MIEPRPIESEVRIPDQGVSRRLIVAGWSLLVGWWFVCYLLTINAHGWIWTEIATLNACRLSFAAMLANRATFGHCPLFFSFSWVLQQVFGENEIVLRLPSVVFGLACVVFVYRLVRRWEREGTALLAAALVLVSPILLVLSQQARPYALTVLLGLVATDTMIDPGPMDDRKRAIRFGIISLLGLLTSHSYWFVLAAQAVTFVVRPRRYAVMIASCIAAGLGAMPWFLYAKFWAESDGLSEQFLTWMQPVGAATSLALPGRLIGFDAFSQHIESILPIVITIVTLLVVAIGLARVPGGPHIEGSVCVRRTLAALWLVPPVGALIAGLLGWGDLLLVPRYFALTAMVQFILIAVAISSIRLPLRTVIGAFLVFVLAGQSLFVLREAGRDEIRRAAGIVNADRGRAEAVVAFGARKYVRVFKYYVDGSALCVMVAKAPDGGEGDTDQNLAGIRVGKRGAWVLLPANRRGLWASTRSSGFEVSRYLDALGDRYEMIETHELGEHVLLHFQGRAGRPPS